MTSSTQSLSTETSLSNDLDDALEADVQATLVKALRLFENGEKELAGRLFERLRQRVQQAGPTAVLVASAVSAQQHDDLRDVVNAIADIARSTPAPDEEAEPE
jgi:hypothetical protein